MRKYFVHTVAVALFFLCACQQEINDIITEAEQQQCRIDSAFYDDNQNTGSFEYDASGRLIRFNILDGYYTYTFSGDRISTRRYFDTLFGETLFIDSVFYNSNGHISELRMLDLTGFIMDTLAARYVYQYQNSKVSRILYIESWDNGFELVHDTLPVTFHWNAAGNIQKLVYSDNTGTAMDSVEYMYDNNPNYFKLLHPDFYLLDPRIRIHVGLEANLPYYLSSNNVVNSNIYGSFDNEVVYGMDSVNRLGSIEMGGIEYARYKFKCQ